MAVVNQEYNFNYPNMNFGQMLMYGVLGGLTGGNGLGCYGGFNQGWGASIFPMGTMMTGYNCMAGMGCYSDSMVAAQVTSSVLSMGLQALGSYIECRGGKNDNDTPVKTEAEYQTEAEAIVDKAHPNYKKDITKATNAVSVANTQCEAWTKSLDAIEGLKNQLKFLGEPVTNAPEGETQEQKVARENKNSQIASIKQQIKDEEKKIGNAKLVLAGANITDVNLSTMTPEQVLAAANTMLEKANKVRDDAIKAEIKNIKDKEVQNAKTSQSSTISNSKQLAKAQKEADRAEAKKLKAEEQKRIKAEKEAEETKENNIKDYRKQFNNALSTCNRAAANRIINEIKTKYPNDIDYLQLASAFTKNLNNSFGL